jgi:hypothetical protein
LFYPPSVAGWEGGRAWLNGQTFLLRQNLALALTSTSDSRFGRRLDPAEMLRRHNADSPEAKVDLLLRVFLQSDVPTASRDRLVQYAASREPERHPVYWTEADIANHRVRTLCHLVLCLPEYQLE